MKFKVNDFVKIVNSARVVPLIIYRISQFGLIFYCRDLETDRECRLYLSEMKLATAIDLAKYKLQT